MTRLLLAATAALAIAAVPAAPAAASPCGSGVLAQVCALDPRPLTGCYQPPPNWFEFCL